MTEAACRAADACNRAALPLDQSPSHLFRANSFKKFSVPSRSVEKSGFRGVGLIMVSPPSNWYELRVQADVARQPSRSCWGTQMSTYSRSFPSTCPRRRRGSRESPANHAVHGTHHCLQLISFTHSKQP